MPKGLTKITIISNFNVFFEHSPIAQSVEQVAVNHPVGGSSPSRGDEQLKLNSFK